MGQAGFRIIELQRHLVGFKAAIRGDSSFSTWLFRVTANEALMMMRSQRRHRARLAEGLDLEDLANLPAANSAAERPVDEPADASAAQNERDAWVRHMLMPDVPDLAGYLGDTMSARTTGTLG